MTPQKKIVYRNIDGSITVVTPQLYELVILQRGRPDYDPTDDIQLLVSGGLPPLWIQQIFEMPSVDIERERKKVESNGRDPASIPAYLAYQVARQQGGLTFEAALQAIIDKDIAWKTTEYAIFDADRVPNGNQHEMRLFRKALNFNLEGCFFDVTKCKEIAHKFRREKREEEFKPYDDIIAKQIPGKDKDAAEAARAVIRQKYDLMQSAIDSSNSPEQIKAALSVNA